MPLKKLKEFEDTGWGILVRYGIIVLCAAVLAIFDSRYITYGEIEKKEQQMHEIRAGDINMILKRTEEIAKQASTNATLNASVDNRLNRIEAQTEIILQYVQQEKREQ